MQNGITVYSLRHRNGATAQVASLSLDQACKQVGWFNSDTVLDGQGFVDGIVIDKTPPNVLVLGAREYDSNRSGFVMPNWSSL